MLKNNVIYNGTNGRMVCKKCAGNVAQSGYDLYGVRLEELTYHANLGWIKEYDEPMKCESGCLVYPSHQETLKILDHAKKNINKKTEELTKLLLYGSFTELDTFDFKFKHVTTQLNKKLLTFVDQNNKIGSIQISSPKNKILWVCTLNESINNQVISDAIKILNVIAKNNTFEPIKHETIKLIFSQL